MTSLTMHSATMPDKILNVSQTQFSIARHYGGITFNGVEYIYNPVEDSLTRADLLRKPKVKRKPKPKVKNETGELFGDGNA